MDPDDPAPLVRLAEEWFRTNGWSPFPFQREVWTAFLSGESGVVHAPTGTGKTLAAWIGPLLRFGVGKTSGIRALWITPLRALAADTARSLQEAADALNTGWRVEMRTGDTPSTVRERQKRNPPHALVITPESLSLLLSYPETRTRFGALQCVVVDEWHELLGTKRGVQTELALARLKRWNPALQVWGLSATLGNLSEAMAALLGAGSGRLVSGDLRKPVEVQTVLPESVQRFPWSGHMGFSLLPQVVEAILQARTTLVFTNTRNQCENWYQALTLYEPDMAPFIGLHHGSLDRGERERVERGLAEGTLKCVVCTSSLDLGVDFSPVELVVQVGSPKGVARLLQRAGRSGHQPDGISRIVCVPTNAFEMVEFAAARRAIEARDIEARVPLMRPLDVLAQHLVTCALGGGFSEKEMLEEVRSAYAYHNLTDQEWRWTLDFVVRGGDALHAYPQYRRVVEQEGVYRVPDAEIAKMHRMSVGTIASEQAVTVQYSGGSRLGTVEESFIARLRPGDRFIFAGKLLELVRVKEMQAVVKPARGKRGTVPRWDGGKMPLSTQLGRAVRNCLAEPDFSIPEMSKIEPLLRIQHAWSVVPMQHELLVERTQSREGHHLFLFPFMGRLVNEGIASLMAFRLSRTKPLTLLLSATDYGLELLCEEYIHLEPDDWDALLRDEDLGDDLMQCVNSIELTRRRFREIARVAGLIFQGYPGSGKSARQLQAGSGLLFDVLSRFDPQNMLLLQARREVLESQLEVSLLRNTLQNLQQMQRVEVVTERLSPFAFPVWAERIQSQIVSTETFSERIAKIAVQLEAIAG
jgi:ATP-dependent Lhr-like helicase